MSDKQLIEVLTKLNKQQEARIEEQDKTEMRAAEERVLEKMGIVRA